METDSDSIFKRIKAIYQATDLVEENHTLWVFKNIQKVQGLEEIGREELFRHKIKTSCQKMSHNGIIVRPNKNATVMIIGNHSAGKSSFINWYVGENLQSTGIALETSHFTMVTHGAKSQEIKSEGTLRLYPFLHELLQHGDKKIYGTFFANLNTKVCNSTERSFESVDFIDTPGLTDGNVKYHCDILEVMKWLSKYVDLVLVFLDPVGQGLCNKTIDMVEFLCKNYPEKLKIYLSKADQIENEEDLNKLYFQISASLTDRLNFQHGLHIYPFSILKNELPFANRRDIICKDIDSCIGFKTERNISTLSADCIFVKEHCRFLLEEDQYLRNQKNRVYMLRIIAFIIFSLILLSCFNLIPLPISELMMIVIGLVSTILVIVSFMIDKKPFNSQQRARISKWQNYAEDSLAELERIKEQYYDNI